ncbi:MAG: DUF2599 domain-containing protein [Mycobacterium sp.]
MWRTLLAAAVVPAAVLAAVPAAADPVVPGHFVHSTEWAKWGDLSTLRVYPTAEARVVAGSFPVDLVAADVAWAEVLSAAPEADLPGMREQFVCHWEYAELAQPGKTSWNLEPWRPVVGPEVMVGSGCNPGGTEEPF